jgi:hypothetical protein
LSEVLFTGVNSEETDMETGKIKQRYAARHLTPKSRVILALSHKQLSEQLVALRSMNDKAGYPGADSKQKTFFREAWSKTIQKR